MAFMTQAEKLTTMTGEGWSVGKILGYLEEDAEAKDHLAGDYAQNISSVFLLSCLRLLSFDLASAP